MSLWKLLVCICNLCTGERSISYSPSYWWVAGLMIAVLVLVLVAVWAYLKLRGKDKDTVCYKSSYRIKDMGQHFRLKQRYGRRKEQNIALHLMNNMNIIYRYLTTNRKQVFNETFPCWQKYFPTEYTAKYTDVRLCNTSNPSKLYLRNTILTFFTRINYFWKGKPFIEYALRRGKDSNSN